MCECVRVYTGECVNVKVYTGECVSVRVYICQTICLGRITVLSVTEEQAAVYVCVCGCVCECVSMEDKRHSGCVTEEGVCVCGELKDGQHGPWG